MARPKKAKTIKATQVEEDKIEMKSSGMPKKRIFLAIILIAIVIIVFQFKGLFVAATVNGQPISRIQVIQELEKEGGKSVLDNLVTNNLILQEADKEKVTVSQAEISAQITQITDNLKSQGQDLNSALTAQGMTQTDLSKQVKLQILVQKMAGKGITVTDQEAEGYFKQNTTAYPKGAKYADEAASIKST